jgi:hypothetical protein
MIVLLSCIFFKNSKVIHEVSKSLITTRLVYFLEINLLLTCYDVQKNTDYNLLSTFFAEFVGQMVATIQGNRCDKPPIQDQIRLPHTKVSPEIQSPSYFTLQGITLQEFLKVVRSFKFREYITNY